MHGLVHLWSLTVIATFNVGNSIYRRNSDPAQLCLRLQPVLHFDLSHCQQPLASLRSLVTRLLFRHLTRQNYFLTPVTSSFRLLTTCLWRVGDFSPLLQFHHYIIFAVPTISSSYKIGGWRDYIYYYI